MKKNITLIYLIVVLSLSMFSCKLVQKPAYNLKENYPLSAKEIEPKWKNSVNPLMLLVDAGLITWGFGGGQLNIPDEQGKMDNIAPLFAIGGTIHGLMTIPYSLRQRGKRLSDVRENEYTKWLTKYNRKNRTDYKIFRQNSNSLTIVPSRNLNEFTELIAKSERQNAIRPNYFWENMAKIATVGVAAKLLYDAYNSSNSSSSTGGSSSSDGGVIYNGTRENEKKDIVWHCNDNGTMITIRQSGSVYFIGNESFSSWTEAKKGACIKTNCKNCN